MIGNTSLCFDIHTEQSTNKRIAHLQHEEYDDICLELDVYCGLFQKLNTEYGVTFIRNVVPDEEMH